MLTVSRSLADSVRMKMPLEVSDKLTLREARQDDTEFAYQVKKAAYKEYVERVWGWKEEEQRQIHDRHFRAEDFSVIALDGTEVGIMQVTADADCVHVDDLYILPEHQGQGVGQQCMSMAIQRGSEMGLPIRLRVLKVNTRATALYERLGFTHTGETDTHLLMERRA